VARNEAVVDLRQSIQHAQYAPPEFSTDNRCDECTKKSDEPASPEQEGAPGKSSRFNVLTNRRHHCRRCSRSLCDRHCNQRRIIEVFGYNEPVRVCDSCCEHLDWGSELGKDMRQKDSGSMEQPWAQNSWVDKAVAFGHPAHVVEEPVEIIIKMQDNIVRLEKTIEHTIARQVECEAVLELKVRACAELQAGLERAQQALTEVQGDDETRLSIDRLSERLSVGMAGSVEGAMSADDCGEPHHAMPVKRKKGKGLAGRPALGQLTPNTGGTPSKAKKMPAKKKKAEFEVESSSPLPIAAGSASLGSSAGVSPICVSWYRDSAREAIFPEWIELAIAMGYDRDVTNAAVSQLLSKPAKFHTFDAFVDTLEGMAPDEASAASSSSGEQPSTQQEKRSSSDLRAKMKQFEELQGSGVTGSACEGIVQNAGEIPEDQLLCNVCMNHKVQVMFKCGHLKCEDCANKLIQSTEPLCPDCRMQLTSPRKFFLP